MTTTTTAAAAAEAGAVAYGPDFPAFLAGSKPRICLPWNCVLGVGGGGAAAGAAAGGICQDRPLAR